MNDARSEPDERAQSPGRADDAREDRVAPRPYRGIVVCAALVIGPLERAAIDRCAEIGDDGQRHQGVVHVLLQQRRRHAQGGEGEGEVVAREAKEDRDPALQQSVVVPCLRRTVFAGGFRHWLLPAPPTLNEMGKRALTLFQPQPSFRPLSRRLRSGLPMGLSRELANGARAWPFEEARKVVAASLSAAPRELWLRKSYSRPVTARRVFRISAPLARSRARAGSGRPSRRSPTSLRGWLRSPTTWTACGRFPTTCPTRTCCGSIWASP